MLAIDDEECIRKLLYAVLVRQGHEVWGAESGERRVRDQAVRADASEYYHPGPASSGSGRSDGLEPHPGHRSSG